MWLQHTTLHREAITKLLRPCKYIPEKMASLKFEIGLPSQGVTAHSGRKLNHQNLRNIRKLKNKKGHFLLATVFSACVQLFRKTAIRLVYGKPGALLFDADILLKAE